MTTKPKIYPDSIPENVNIPEESLFQMFSKTVEKFSNHILCSFKGKSTTYGEAFKQVKKLANAFLAQGLEKGDRVAILAPNCPQQIIAIFAAIGIGGIIVNISPLYTEKEIHTQLEDSGARVIFTLDMFLDRVRPAIKGTNIESIIVSSVADELPWLKSIAYRLFFGWKNPSINKNSIIPEFSYKYLLEKHSQTFDPVSVDPQDTFILQYTGGTTGVPKGAMLTHYSLYAQLVGIPYWVEWDDNITLIEGEEVIMGALPFSHIFGLTSSLLWSISIGAHIILIPDPRELDEILVTLDKYNASFFFGVPTLFLALADHENTKNYNLSTLKACISGGTSLPEAVSEKFEQVATTVVVEGYGLSEASPITHINPLNKNLRKPGTMGVPFINTQAKIIDLDSGEEITEIEDTGHTKPGMLYVKGPQLMKGYWQAPDATEDVMKDGWLKTGDIVVKDADEFYIYKDRVKDMINVSGYKVWPTETEDVLYKHQAVKMAAVIPTPDSHSGEAVKAVIVPKEGHKKPTLEEIRKFCKGKIAPYKIPHYLEYVDKLPLSPVGKVLRKELKREEMGKIKIKT